MSLARFNTLPRVDAKRLLLGCCAAPRWAAEVAARRPFESVAAVIETADLIRGRDVDPALAAHPRIGRPTTARSRREQSGVAAGELTALAEASRRYEERFGHIFLICASGLSGADMLAALHARLENDAVTERAIVLAELRKITRRRLAAQLEGG